MNTGKVTPATITDAAKTLLHAIEPGIKDIFADTPQDDLGAWNDNVPEDLEIWGMANRKRIIPMGRYIRNTFLTKARRSETALRKHHLVIDYEQRRGDGATEPPTVNDVSQAIINEAWALLQEARKVLEMGEKFEPGTRTVTVAKGE